MSLTILNWLLRDLSILLLLNIFSNNYVLADVSVDVLGKPFDNYYTDISYRYAKNIWDMKWFEGKLYLGAGNSSNAGPAPNAGPVPIIYYDPVSCSFKQEGQVNDEQIDRFVVLNGTLHIPGHDARQNWTLGNYYKKNNNIWEKIRRIQNGVHIYDMEVLGGTLFAALGTAKGGAISLSNDNGEHWVNVYSTNARIYSLLKLNNMLYAISNTKVINGKGDAIVMEYNGDSFTARTDLNIPTLFPDTSLDEGKTIKIVNAHSVGDKIFYIGAYRHNDHQMQPFGLYIVSSVGIRKVHLPDGFKPWDLLIKPNNIYLLTNKINREKSIAQVFHASINTPNNFEPLFTINLDSGFIRSFEEKDGVFYLAVGSDIINPKHFSSSEISDLTGTLLEVRLRNN